jgi:hypothetical protein
LESNFYYCIYNLLQSHFYYMLFSNDTNSYVYCENENKEN